MQIKRTRIAFGAWCIAFGIARVGVADAATIEQVAKCRAIAQRSMMVACFNALKRRSTKTEVRAPAYSEDATSLKKDETAPANTEDEAAAKAEGATTKKDQTALASTDDAAATKTEGATSSNREHVAPVKRDATLSSVGPPSADDEPLTTSSINPPTAIFDRPLCVDRDALAGMLVAGLFTSDPKLAVTRGCQTLPSDAELQIVERYPAVFSFMRMIAVKVMSPKRPDLTVGFTIEVASPASNGSSLEAPQ
jgi:hypothetical protein